MRPFHRFILTTLLLAACLGTGRPAQAQDPILAVIKAGVTKAIVAMDLQVQRLQNETIWLQNAQKVLENQLTELRLTEIADWTERQRQLYATYYQELREVKEAIATYRRVRELMQRQAALVAEYERAYRLFQQDGHFTPAERRHMQQVYAGILAESVKSLDLLLLALAPQVTQLSDGSRLELIYRAGDSIAGQYSDLRQFNDQNIRLSLQRAREKGNLQAVQQLYGLPELN